MKGKERGKTGTVLKVLPEEERIIIDGLNLFRKRARPKKSGEKGETVLVPRPLTAANVQLVCRNCKAPTRVGFRSEGGKKVRYCKKCEATT